MLTCQFDVQEARDEASTLSALLEPEPTEAPQWLPRFAVDTFSADSASETAMVNQAAARSVHGLGSEAAIPRMLRMQGQVCTALASV